MVKLMNSVELHVLVSYYRYFVLNTINQNRKSLNLSCTSDIITQGIPPMPNENDPVYT